MMKKAFLVPTEVLMELDSPALFRIYCAAALLRDSGIPPTSTNVARLLGFENVKYVKSCLRHLDNIGWADHYPWRGTFPRDSKKEPGQRWYTFGWFKPSPSPNTPSPGS